MVNIVLLWIGLLVPAQFQITHAQTAQEAYAYSLAKEFRECKIAFGNRKKLSLTDTQSLYQKLQKLKSTIQDDPNLVIPVTYLTVPLLMRVFRNQNVLDYIDYYLPILADMLNKPWPEYCQQVLNHYQQALKIGNRHAQLQELIRVRDQMTTLVKDVYNLQTEDFNNFKIKCDIHNIIDARTELAARIKKLEEIIKMMEPEKRRR